MISLKTGSQKIVTRDAEQKFDIYSNHTGIMTSGFDIKLLFGTVQNATELEINILQYGSVIMSPQHAKKFSQSLSTAIENYEKTYGEIGDVDKANKIATSI